MSARFFVASIAAWSDGAKVALLIGAVLVAGAAANLVGAFSIVGTWG